MKTPARESREKNGSCTTKHRQPARGEEKSRFGLPLFSGGSALPTGAINRRDKSTASQEKISPAPVILSEPAGRAEGSHTDFHQKEGFVFFL